MSRLLIGLFLLLALPLPAFQNTQKYYLSVCSLFRDEARFLKEWIEYHRLVGVEHFYLINHFSKDDYLSVLQPYIDQGIVELFHWTIETYDQRDYTKNIQVPAYNKILREKRRENFWIAFIDNDEFIVPIETDTIPPFLKEFEQKGALSINWQMYGTSDIPVIPENKTLIGSLIKKAPITYHLNILNKLIINARYADGFFFDPHMIGYKGAFHAVNENHQFSNYFSTVDNIQISKIRINHYVNRDKKFFDEVKKPRYLKWFGLLREEDPLLNTIEDPIILRFVPELEKRLFN